MRRLQPMNRAASFMRLNERTMNEPGGAAPQAGSPAMRCVSSVTTSSTRRPLAARSAGA